MLRAIFIVGTAVVSALITGVFYPSYASGEIVSPMMAMLLAAVLAGGVTWVLTVD